jgi:cytochrome c6
MRERLVAIFTIALLAAPAWGEGNEAGKAVYDKQCASCHGADGKGNAKRATMLKIDAAKLDLTRAEAAGMTADQKKTVLVEGKGKMPAYGKKLKPEEVDAVLNHAMALAGGGKASAKPTDRPIDKAAETK